MRKFLKIVGGVIILLLIVAGGAVAFAQFGSEHKLARVVTFDVKPVAIPSDAASLERGHYLFDSRGCAECHGRDGAGKVVIDDPGGFYVKSPNITSGAGSAVRDFADVDWVKAIRHGVKPDGRPLLVMPSEDYARYTDADVGAIVAYVKSLPPAAGEGAVLKVPLLVRFLYAIGQVRDAAEKIDHTLPPEQPPSADLVAQGAYIANGCKGCHNDVFAGGKIPGTPPDWPPAANLTPGEDSALVRYPTPDALIAMFHSGKRPDGTAVSDVMPFPSLKEMTDTDIRAVYAFLKTLPPKKHGERS